MGKSEPKNNVDARLSDPCISCGGKMAPSTKPTSLLVNGEEMKGLRVRHIRCTKCGQAMFSIDEARQVRELAFEKYRKRYRLLTADEIRSLRERFHMSQRKLAEYLRLGEVTIARWESNRNVQTAAMDLLLKLIRDVPGAAEYIEKDKAA